MSSPARAHRIGLALLIAPGTIGCFTSLLIDVARGRDFVAGWGTGQSVLLLISVVALVMGILLHRKAIAEELRTGRRYGRTLTFVLVPLVVLIGFPLCLAEIVARWLPLPDDTNTSYRQSDPKYGFSIAPNRHYHVVSRPKNFDIQVRIDDHGHRLSPGEPVLLESANVVVVGDSHPFGFGVAEDQTLAAHLHRQLRQDGLPSRVLNSGVPGFGLGQTLLRIQSFQGKLPFGAVIVVFVNPNNDLVNLSSAVDYHYPKPHAKLTGDQLVFQKAPEDWGEGAFLFSRSFDSLNEFFGLADRRKWYHSDLYRRLSQSNVQPPTVDGVTELVDQTSPDQFLIDDKNRIAGSPLLYASRFWPEMPRFASERAVLSDLVGAVFAEMQKSASQSQWHLVVVVAQEAYAHQAYSKKFLEQVQAVIPDTPIEWGWSRATVQTALDRLSIDTVAPDYAGLDPEPLFVQNDDHTSGLGHQLIADQVANTITQEGWLSNE